MGEDKSVSIQQKNCCRLCLAPNNECISIINSFAADKEPLTKKIQNCVSIKISITDRLSLCVCHACISYLNSWQSFKNRCLAAQQKQLRWLDNAKNPDSDFSTPQQQQQSHQNDDDMSMNEIGSSMYNDQSHLSSTILDGITSLKKRKSITVYSLPAVQVKEEPLDEPDEYDCKNEESDDMVDPTMFLERTEEVGDEPIMEYNNPHPQQESQQIMPQQNDAKEASCRACNLKFSTRANARRHERNLHPNLFELAPDTANSALTTKPIPALAAALELQRAAANAAAVEASKAGISPQKFRQEVLNAFNKTEGTDLDYDHPEKYQQLLTDEKIIFIQQNEEFLQQYQNMTCRCCNKYFNTYKNFMAHMRKKYPTLPRNLCFNCLKLNYSKALFISHLKKRNCINMYKVMHSLMAKSPSFAAAVNASVASTTEKLRAKELLVNKMYECKLCGKPFRLKHEFRSHIYEKHGDAQRKDTDGTQCSFCGLEINDPVERKRHNNNMDCLVSLCCLTCDTKFDGNQRFLDHVQDTHLKAFEQQQMQQNDFAAILSLGRAGSVSTDESRSNNTTTPPSAPKGQYFSRMPQACPICGQRYNNYNNVLRHMESKHPDQLPQTYKCVKCGIGYPRLSNLREHMGTAHNEEKTRHSGFEYIVNADATKIKDNNSAYTGRYDYVMKDLLSITNGGNIDDNDDESSESAAKKIRLDNNGSVNNGENLISSIKTCPICNASFSNNIGLSNHMRSHTAANQSATIATINAVTRTTPKSLTITPIPAVSNSSSNAIPTNTPNQLQNQTPEQQLLFRRSLEQAADRRFRRMRCRFCQKRFSSKKSYRQHMIADHNVHNVQFIKCKLCSAEFAQEKGLKVHMFKIHNTLLKDDTLHEHIQFECDVCSIVYRTEDELIQHKNTVHNPLTTKIVGDGEASLGALETNSIGGGDLSGISTPAESIASSNGGPPNSSTGPLYWYQCKYCPSNFNTNKKLAIHINSHDEFDSKDYSCKDCGNVYSGRKSLWVHRYKKHPQIPDPSECVLCKKIFFDAQMLENHLPSCNRKPNNNSSGVTNPESSQVIYKHKTGDDEDGEEDNSNDVNEDGTSRVHTGLQVLGTLGGGQVEVSAMTPSNLKIKLPEVACTMCGARFSDQDLFAAHIKKHEMELYTDNPLAAMFDTEPTDPHQFFLDRQNESGEYACDLCPKAFSNVVALKVHRKWHFRGDSKQNVNCINSNTNKTNNLTNNNNHSSSNKSNNKNQNISNSNSKNITNPNLGHNQNSSSSNNKPKNSSSTPTVSIINSNNSPSSNIHSNSINNSEKIHNDHVTAATPPSTTPASTIAPTSPKNRLPRLGLQVVGLLNPSNPSQQQQQEQQQPLEQEQQQQQQESLTECSKSQKRKRELKCNFCDSIFITNNNLRRHLYEIHKDETSHLPQPPVINCDEPMHCLRCDIKFPTKQEWVEHKIREARLMKPFSPFQWGCDICGIYLSRKEKLINHINSHMKEVDISTLTNLDDEIPTSNNNTSIMNHNRNIEIDPDEDSDEDDDDDDDDGDEEDDEIEDEDEEEDDEEEEDDGTETAIKKYKIQSPLVDDQDMDSLDIAAENEVAEVEIEAENAMESHDEYESDVGLHEEPDESEDDDEEDDGEEEVEEEITDDEHNSSGQIMQVNENANHANNLEHHNDTSDISDIEDDDDDEDNMVIEEGVEVEDSNDSRPPLSIGNKSNNETSEAEDSPSYSESDLDDSDSDDGDDSRHSSHSARFPPPILRTRFSCDLCSVFFETQLDLQKHVKMHFLNGPGSVSLAKATLKRSSSSSSNDVVAVNSS